MTFNLWTFLFEVFNFVVLAYVLHRLLYRPLARGDRRTRARRTNGRRPRPTRPGEEAAALQQHLETQLAELERQRQEIGPPGPEQALAERQKLLDDAARTVQQKQEAARTALGPRAGGGLAALRGEMIDQAVQLSRRLLGEAASRRSMPSWPAGWSSPCGRFPGPSAKNCAATGTRATWPCSKRPPI